MNTYADFIQRKSQIGGDSGFAPNYLPESLFPFQRALVEWATRKGRRAIGAELKPSYFRQAVANLEALDAAPPVSESRGLYDDVQEGSELEAV